MSSSGTSTTTSKASRLVRVGNYELTPGYLGKGTFAIVRLGVHKLTRTIVAVKIVEKADLDDENLHKINREIQIMRHLNHPSIIRLFQVMDTETMIYIVTEYASKGDIFDHLVKTGKMSEPDACHVFAQILSAVKYCHTQGVVHRDLKVENLLLDNENNIKLADFGFSNYYDSSLMSTWCGSPPYAAPELFEGKEYNGPKVDIWSLGVVLYVLVSGTLPFNGDTLMQLRDNVVKCQYRVPWFLSQEIQHLLKGLLVIEPEKRLSIDAIAKHSWTAKVASSMTKPILEKLLSTKSLETITPINENTIEAIVREVNVLREPVISSVTQNKCDELCAIYHMVEFNLKERERERLQAFTALIPPLSPTSMSPFFNSSASATSEHVRPVTEVYNAELNALDYNNVNDDDRTLPNRRHTLGPGQPPKHYTPPRPYLIPGTRAILPQNNLTQNLPLVCNLPPERFSVKDPHLLRPPPALSGLSATGRRASDGDAYLHSKEEEPSATSASTTPVEGCDNSLQIQQQISTGIQSGISAKSPQSPQPPPDSPRKRRTGLHVVNQEPEISPDLRQEVECRMRAQASSNSTTPKTSPNKPGSLRARRTGLSTVMEMKSLQHPNEQHHQHQLPLISPEPPDHFRCITTSTNDASAATCDAIRVVQEEAAAARLAQNEGASSADSASSGYMSPHFLRPPSPSDDLMQPRRSSDSGVDLPGHECGLRNSASAPSKPIQQLYDEMYMDPASPAVTLNNSRRYSYPNSPVHNQLTSSTSTVSSLSHHHATHDLRIPQSTQLTNHLQQLRLQQYIISEEGSTVPNASMNSRPVSHKWKGSITQGVPSRPPTTSPTPSLLTPILDTGPYMLGHSHSFDDAYDHTLKPRGMSGSASTLWESSGMEDTEVDYISLVPYTPMSPIPISAPPTGVPFPNSDHPEICVTNVTGDEIKFVFGAAAESALNNSDPNRLGISEPMDHS